MPMITYIEHDGTEHTVDVEENMTLMEGATLNLLPGIEGMCGGICSCCTCHVYIPEDFLDKCGEMSDNERQLLDGSEFRRDNSRLGCQVVVSWEMEGLRVDLPAEQR